MTKINRLNLLKRKIIMVPNEKKKSNPAALLPIGVFLVLYLGLGLIFEYVLKIEMGFYQIPIVVVFLVALLVAFLQNRKLKIDDKLRIVSAGVGDKDIITMILIFLTAGIFVGVTGRDSAEAVAYFLLSVTPAWAAVAVLFMASCFMSVAMGTSVGTITLITPIAVAVANVSGFSLPLCIGSVMGGAMFGDNLSFISDTTIAACNSQGCAMGDKFRANFKIALPAAIVTFILIIAFSFGTGVEQIAIPDYNLLLLIPYVLVLVGGICGINVFVVLLIGIFSGALMTLITGSMDIISLLGSMGSGASGMFETIMVTILVSAMCALIREFGGFETLLGVIRWVFRGRIGGRLGVGLLVGAMDIATANNTVAIVMAGPIAKEISEEYGITPRESASLLDTFSCIFQGVIPYGAQMLVAVSTAISLGSAVSAFDILPFLFYPGLLLVTSLVYIIFSAGKKTSK
ncbi:MAG: Na+/H+ antiporter NhaC family protein [Oscillospiraceae bacterium]|nr:Na+/H+ antiporter NhaC family protein [Oscillospiraceae bacterium]